MEDGTNYVYDEINEREGDQRNVLLYGNDRHEAPVYLVEMPDARPMEGPPESQERVSSSRRSRAASIVGGSYELPETADNALEEYVRKNLTNFRKSLGPEDVDADERRRSLKYLERPGEIIITPEPLHEMMKNVEVLGSVKNKIADEGPTENDEIDSDEGYIKGLLGEPNITNTNGNRSSSLLKTSKNEKSDRDRSSTRHASFNDYVTVLPVNLGADSQIFKNAASIQESRPPPLLKSHKNVNDKVRNSSDREKYTTRESRSNTHIFLPCNLSIDSPDLKHKRRSTDSIPVRNSEPPSLLETSALGSDRGANKTREDRLNTHKTESSLDLGKDTPILMHKQKLDSDREKSSSSSSETPKNASNKDKITTRKGRLSNHITVFPLDLWTTSPISTPKQNLASSQEKVPSSSSKPSKNASNKRNTTTREGRLGTHITVFPLDLGTSLPISTPKQNVASNWEKTPPYLMKSPTNVKDDDKTTTRKDRLSSHVTEFPLCDSPTSKHKQNVTSIQESIKAGRGLTVNNDAKAASLHNGFPRSSRLQIVLALESCEDLPRRSVDRRSKNKKRPRDMSGKKGDLGDEANAGSKKSKERKQVTIADQELRENKPKYWGKQNLNKTDDFGTNEKRTRSKSINYINPGQQGRPIEYSINHEGVDSYSKRGKNKLRGRKGFPDMSEPKSTYVIKLQEDNEGFSRKNYPRFNTFNKNENYEDRNSKYSKIISFQDERPKCQLHPEKNLSTTKQYRARELSHSVNKNEDGNSGGNRGFSNKDNPSLHPDQQKLRAYGHPKAEQSRYNSEYKSSKSSKDLKLDTDKSRNKRSTSKKRDKDSDSREKRRLGGGGEALTPMRRGSNLARAPRSQSRMFSMKRYHVQIPDEGREETPFNVRFDVADAHNVDMSYSGPVKITPYYSTNKYI